MWTKGWRDSLWADLDRSDWDLVIIGGGITGAGILREASRLGLRCILFEAHDFASGTSSRSSKLVHGGLRYLKDAKFRLTSESVHEREHLLQEVADWSHPSRS
jgi:glycerol-3-phosphate dehydrogenase